MFAGEPRLFPLFLKVDGRVVLVVGAGVVAARKIAGLLEARARVRVVSPEATAQVQDRARSGLIEWIPRSFEERDIEGAWLVVAATGNAETQKRVAAAAEARCVFVLSVDDPPNSSAYSAAVVQRLPFVIAISSSGQAPALTRLLREIIEQILPSDDWVEHA